MHLINFNQLRNERINITINNERFLHINKSYIFKYYFNGCFAKKKQLSHYALESLLLNVMGNDIKCRRFILG